MEEKYTKKCEKTREKKNTPHDGQIMPIATMKAKNTAINLRFFIDVANASLAVMKDKCSVVGLGSFPSAEADNQCLARCKSLPWNNKDFSKS